MSAPATRNSERRGARYTSTPSHQPSTTAPTQADALAITTLRATTSGCSRPPPTPTSPSRMRARTDTPQAASPNATNNSDNPVQTVMGGKCR